MSDEQSRCHTLFNLLNKKERKTSCLFERVTNRGKPILLMMFTCIVTRIRVFIIRPCTCSCDGMERRMTSWFFFSYFYLFVYSVTALYL